MPIDRASTSLARAPAAGEGGVSGALGVLPAFALGMAGLPGELGGLGQRLRSALDRGDWTTCERLLRQFLDKYLREFAGSLEAGGVQAEAEQLRELLRQALGLALASLLQPLPALADESSELGAELKQWRPGRELAPLARRVRELCHRVGVHAGEVTEQQALLLELFDLLLENLSELLDDGSWLQGQVATVRELLAGNPDRQALEATRQGLREMAYQQGLLKQGIAESKDAVRGMMVTFVERLDGMADHTGQFQSRLEHHLEAIRRSRSVVELGKRLDEVLDDTVRLQKQALDARTQMVLAREEVAAAEARIRELESQLRDVGDLAQCDPLTGALNRRGFEDRYAREAAQAERDGRPLALAVLDLDGFGKLNAHCGHAGGDAALRHLVDVARNGLQHGAAVCRHGGDEFILLLPDTPLAEATSLLQRLQKLLAAQPVLHEGERVRVTFSAGVAVRQLGEEREHLVHRADRAMYRAKHAGRDRVVAAH